MQDLKIRTDIRCPDCGRTMKGFSVDYCSYRYSDCGTEVNVFAVATNTGLEPIIGAICIVGVIVLFASLLQ